MNIRYYVKKNGECFAVVEVCILRLYCIYPYLHAWSIKTKLLLLGTDKNQ